MPQELREREQTQESRVHNAPRISSLPVGTVAMECPGKHYINVKLQLHIKINNKTSSFSFINIVTEKQQHSLNLY